MNQENNFRVSSANSAISASSANLAAANAAAAKLSPRSRTTAISTYKRISQLLKERGKATTAISRIPTGQFMGDIRPSGS